MLILDEATSSIDTRTEIRIQKAFDDVDGGPYELHRRPPSLNHPATQMLSLVMRDGNIVEQGTHKELLARKRILRGDL